MSETNPYTSPGAPAEEPAGVVDRFVRFVLRPSLVVSGFLLLHFTASLVAWGVGVANVRHLRFTAEQTWWFLLDAWPTAVGFALSVLACWGAVGNKRFTKFVIVAIVLLSAAAFWYDVSNKRSQMQVTMATREYWEEGGRQHTYLTWWWYNDGWFR